MSALPVTDVFTTGWFSHSCIVGLYTIKPLTSLVTALKQLSTMRVKGTTKSNVGEP